MLKLFSISGIYSPLNDICIYSKSEEPESSKVVSSYTKKTQLSKRGKLFSLSSPAVKISGNTAHGTGCTLSAAVAANLASGKNWQDALITAKAFVYGSLCENMKVNGKLRQMYPPRKNYLEQVVLKEY